MPHHLNWPSGNYWHLRDGLTMLNTQEPGEVKKLWHSVVQGNSGCSYYNGLPMLAQLRTQQNFLSDVITEQASKTDSKTVYLKWFNQHLLEQRCCSSMLSTLISTGITWAESSRDEEGEGRLPAGCLQATFAGVKKLYRLEELILCLKKFASTWNWTRVCIAESPLLLGMGRRDFSWKKA